MYTVIGVVFLFLPFTSPQINFLGGFTLKKVSWKYSPRVAVLKLQPLVLRDHAAETREIPRKLRDFFFLLVNVSVLSLLHLFYVQ